MNKDNARNAIVKDLLKTAIDEALKQGYEDNPAHLQEVATALIEPWVERLLTTLQSNLRVMNESAAKDSLEESIAEAATKIKVVVEWTLEDLKPTQQLTANRVRQIVHARLEKLPRANRLLLEGFFPFKEYEI